MLLKLRGIPTARKWTPFVVALLITLGSTASAQLPPGTRVTLQHGSALFERVFSPSQGAVTEATAPPTNLDPLAPAAVDWPQVQNNPQRTGYAGETLGTTFRVRWTRPFQPEKVHPQVQAIVYSGRVFVGTEMGRLYALDAKTGSQSWVYPVGAPILNSVAAGYGKVYFGAMDGAVYAVHAITGTLAWKNQLASRLGFSTAPVLADGKVMLGGRNGVFYALDPSTGTVVWQYTVGSPILQTAAWNNGRVFFGAMDMRVYALDTATSASPRRAWQSAKISGMAFKDYWPLVYGSKVYIIPTGGRALGVTDGTQVANAAAQQAVLNDYAAHPGNYEKSLFALNESNGQEAPAVIYYPEQTMHGAPSPPCVSRDGYFIIPAPKPTGELRSGWAELDVNQRIVIRTLYQGNDAGYGNGDETFNVTCSQNLVLTFQTQEGNAHDTGYFNLDTRRWTLIGAGHINFQMSTNTQGGGGNPPSIADGWVYHISWHELIARSTQ